MILGPKHKIISANSRLCLYICAFISFSYLLYLKSHIELRKRHLGMYTVHCADTQFIYAHIIHSEYWFYISVERTDECYIDKVIVGTALALLHSYTHTISFFLPFFFLSLYLWVHVKYTSIHVFVYDFIYRVHNVWCCFDLIKIFHCMQIYVHISRKSFGKLKIRTDWPWG